MNKKKDEVKHDDTVVRLKELGQNIVYSGKYSKFDLESLIMAMAFCITRSERSWTMFQIAYQISKQSAADGDASPHIEAYVQRGMALLKELEAS